MEPSKKKKKRTLHLYRTQSIDLLHNHFFFFVFGCWSSFQLLLIYKLNVYTVHLTHPGVGPGEHGRPGRLGEQSGMERRPGDGCCGVDGGALKGVRGLQAGPVSRCSQ